MDRRTVVGPASYAADGIPVDLSAVFSTLHTVRITRAYVTATGVADTRIYEVNEAGTDTIANRKFRAKVFRIPTIATSTDANVVTGTGAIANVTADDVAAAGSCGAVGCNGLHPNGVGTARTDLIQCSGAAKITAVTALTTPTLAKTEIDAATNLSTITIEYEATGVPV